MVASGQVTLLALTRRKADCELNLSKATIEKMALTREQSELSKEYQSRLQAKKVCYYANGQYEKINYNYLMGGQDYMSVLEGSPSLKQNNSMVLTDYKGQVVLSDAYANAITSVLGTSAIDKYGRGGTFSSDKIPEMMAAFLSGFSADDFRTVINNGDIDSYKDDFTGEQTINPENKTGTKEKELSKQEQIEKLVDFYLPIFQAAATNGWTTEYNKDMDPKLNPDYVSDALVTGTFQLESVDKAGEYDEGTSLTYFITAGAIQTRTDSSVREEITAWYNAQKDNIAFKENIIDMQMADWSTELEAINAEMQSIQSFVDDGIQSVFDWGSG